MCRAGALGIVLALALVPRVEAQTGGACDFEGLVTGPIERLETEVGTFRCESSGLAVADDAEGSRALRVPSGEEVRVVLELSDAARAGGSLGFRIRRGGKQAPFSVVVRTEGSAATSRATVITDRVREGDYESIAIALPDGPQRVVFVVTAGGRKGVFLDDVIVRPPAPMELVDVQVDHWTRPLILGELVDVARVSIVTRGNLDPLMLRRVTFWSPIQADGVYVKELTERYADQDGVGTTVKVDQEGGLAKAGIGGELPMGRTDLILSVRMLATDDADAASAIGVQVPFQVEVDIEGERLVKSVSPAPCRTAVRLGALEGGGRMLPSIAYVADLAGSNGWQLALHENPDDPTSFVARSTTDGGLSWASALVHPGMPDGRILRPTLTHDRVDGLLHLHFLWEPEGTPPFGQGFRVEQTPQLCVVESRDRGATWAEPRLLTEAVKDLQWTRLEPAGGRGTRTSLGRLVVPLIAHRLRGGIDFPSVALLRSRDGGATWTVSPAGSGAATWPAIIEAGDGAILANAADQRGGRRAVSALREEDDAWKSIRSSLPCTGGAGALLHVGRETRLSMDGRFVFLGAARNDRGAWDMTLRGSNDSGSKWPDSTTILLDGGRSVAAPALSMVAGDAVGALYRSSDGTVVFQRVPLEEACAPVPTFGGVTGGK